MPPDLVIADAPYTTYPGGVIAIRCADWIAGGASSETDALAIEDDVVRETQQVTTSILDDPWAAYAEAADTLTIPVADLVVEGGINYDVFVSYRLEGEWDVTNIDVLDASRQDRFDGVGLIGIHGTVDADEANAELDTRFLCRIDNYSMKHIGTLFDLQSDQTLTVRAATIDGSTAEWVLDQIVLFPTNGPSPWTADDFEEVSGGIGLVSDIGPPQDGADGGDDNGKFTFYVSPDDEMEIGPGVGGDYQQKSDGDDAEWLVQLTTDDTRAVFNSQTGDETNVNAYALYGARYRPVSVVTHDDFSNRTTAPGSKDFGITPEGYSYAVGASTPDAFVNGVGQIRGPGIAEVVMGRVPAAGFPGDGAHFSFYDQVQWSGRWRWSAGSDTAMRMSFTIHGSASGHDPDWELRVDMVAKTWTLGKRPPFVALGSAHSIAWFGVGAWVGFRMEIKRYVLRVRLWDASGAEPSTWDEELFVPVRVSAVDHTYPYGDDETLAAAVYRSRDWFDATLTTSPGPGQAVVQISDSVIEFDPYGDPGDMSARLERPEGTLIGDITIPYGAAYFVHWGTLDMTDLVATVPYLEYSAKVWNEPGVAEMQRAECNGWWFRSLHGGVVSMNWRSSDRGASVKRVHSG